MAVAQRATAIKLSKNRPQKVSHPERSQRGTSCEVKDPEAISMDGVLKLTPFSRVERGPSVA